MRIQLRRLTEKDRFALTAIIDRETAKWAKLPYPFTKEVAENFILNYNTFGIWIAGSMMVGAIEIKEDCETAYFIHRNFRNMGLATKAVEMILDYYADRQLFALINPNNKASLRVAQKANMRIKFID